MEDRRCAIAGQGVELDAPKEGSNLWSLRRYIAYTMTRPSTRRASRLKVSSVRRAVKHHSTPGYGPFVCCGEGFIVVVVIVVVVVRKKKTLGGDFRHPLINHKTHVAILVRPRRVFAGVRVWKDIQPRPQRGQPSPASVRGGAEEHRFQQHDDFACAEFELDDLPWPTPAGTQTFDLHATSPADAAPSSPSKGRRWRRW